MEDNKDKRKFRETPKFDTAVDIKNMLQGDKRNKLFLSSRGGESAKNSGSLSVSIRQPNRSQHAQGFFDSGKDLKEKEGNEKTAGFGHEDMELGESQHFADL